jgi:hypothetical protein
VRKHLLGAQHIAVARRALLGPLQAVNRALLLDELRRYRKRGRFPFNHDSHAQPIPLFIDSHGTRCAVAHLMEISGHGQLVRHIAQTDNTAPVHRLARLWEVRAWLNAAGLSLDEASRIQPTYCSVSEAEACFCHEGRLSNLAMGTIVSTDRLTVEVSVQRIEGEYPGLMIDEQTSVAGSGEVGEPILFSRDPDSSVASRVGSNLVVTDTDVRCQLNQGTARRPVTVDTVFDALLAETSIRLDVLANDHSAWNQSQCGTSEGGCGLTENGNAAVGAVELTSAAILMALASYRRIQRR